MKKLFLVIVSVFVIVPAISQVNIKIDTSSKGVQISPMLYGIFYEDINHAADGGIYAELIRNRSFEDSPEELSAWTTFGEGTTATLSTKDLLNKAQHQCLHFVSAQKGGISNEGFWGINAVKGRQYRVSLWIKVKKAGNLKAVLSCKCRKKEYASVPLVFDPRNKNWQKVTATFTSNANNAKAVFSVVADGKTDVLMDVVSLFPPTYMNRENGLRPDLVEMLWNLHPRFMRFPGGCFVEGQDTPDNAFRWERTVGPIEQRPGHWNKNWGYRTSDGLGFHEYLQLAEDLGAKPLYVTNIGIWHGGVTPLDSLQPWIDECLNALEYANGDVTTKYGAMRAKNGHPAPFGIEYIEIGNENNQNDGQQTSDHYYDRYRLFRNAIVAKYPDMHIIGDVAAWGTDDPRWESKEKVNLVDEHYYRSPAWFAKHFKKYDSYDRSWPKVYCGEYAVTQGFGNLGDLNAALGEAVYMMGMENNADIVSMCSYAPIFVNENDDRWRPDMVRFSSGAVMGTPSYYVQKLMAENLATRALKVTEGSEVIIPETKIYTPEKSHVGIGTYGTKATFRDIMITADGKTINVDTKDLSAFDGVDAKDWKVSADGLMQIGGGTPTFIMTKAAADSRKYSVSMKARKDEGVEGFILLFNLTDKDNYAWLNLGGWGNSKHGIEQCEGAGRGAIDNVDGHVETGRWYDVRVDVDGNNITGYLDGEKIIETVLEGTDYPGIFTSASMDDKTGEMVVKIVNTSGVQETANFDLGSFVADGATLIQMKAEDGLAENTLHTPTDVFPTTRHITFQGSKPSFSVAPYSINVLRIKH